MVVESIIRPEWIEKDSLYALPLGFCLAVIGISIGGILFRNDASVVGLLFTTIAAVPFLQNILTREEIREEHASSFKNFFIRNQKVLDIYLMFFFGITFAYLLLYLLLPVNIVTLLFGKQLSIFSFLGASTNSLSTATLFSFIVTNNVKILAITLVLSLLYGAGAIFIIAWNASVLGIFLATLGNLPSIILTLPHALTEFIGFFVAAVAGALISIAFSREKIKSAEFKSILNDALIMFFISIGIIILAAVIEVNVGVLA